MLWIDLAYLKMVKLKNTETDIAPSIVAELKRKAILDFIFCVALVVTLTAITLIMEVELVEEIFEFTREHEDWELDEYLMGLLWLGLISVLYAARRVSDLKRLNQEIVHSAFFDPVTKLPNRILALDRVEKLVKQADREDKQVVAFFIDVDKFKFVNDTYGHYIGDQLIEMVGQRISNATHMNETVARLGGDEFLVVALFQRKSDEVYKLIDRLQRSQQEPYSVAKQQLSIKYSIGVANYPMDAKDATELIKYADIAMYEAKSKGMYHLYSEGSDTRLTRRFQLSQKLEQAIRNNELYLVYQPFIRYPTQLVVGYEALIRWNDRGSAVNPELLISVAEEFGLIHDIGQWVIETACKQAKHIEPNRFISVNVSVHQFLKEGFAETISEVLSHSGLNTHQLELEVTESAFITDMELANAQLKAIKDLGVNIAVDDFGIGYSSLNRLKYLEIDKLKIDRSFIAAINEQGKDYGIVKAMITLAQSLGLEVVAEGVETVDQAEMVKSLGCDTMQGYLFVRPDHLP